MCRTDFPSMPSPFPLSGGIKTPPTAPTSPVAAPVTPPPVTPTASLPRPASVVPAGLPPEQVATDVDQAISQGAATAGDPATLNRFENLAAILPQLGLNQAVLDTRHAPRQAASLEEALQIADADAGDEAILELSDAQGAKTYAVVDLKAQTSAQNLFSEAPAAGAPRMNSVLIDHQKSHQEGSVASTSNRLESVQPLSEPAPATLQAASALELANVALDQKGGFNPAKAPFGGRVVSYDQNLMVATTRLQEAGSALEHEISTLRADPNLYNDPARLAQLNDHLMQLEEIKTAQGILKTRLLLAAPSNRPIAIPGPDGQPGTQNIGDGRKTAAARAEVLSALRGRLASVQAALASDRDELRQLQQAGSQDPAVLRKMELLRGHITSLERQEQRLGQEITQAGKKILGIAEAGLKQSIRTGALIKMSAAIQIGRQGLQDKIGQYRQLQTDLMARPGERVAIEAQMKTLAREIDAERQQLVDTLNTELGTFRAHLALGQGAKDAVSLLETEIQKLQALQPLSAEGLLAPEEADRLLRGLDNLEQRMYKSQSDSLVARLRQEPWQGISPQETRILEQIDARTNDYVRDHRAVQQQQELLRRDLQAASQIPAFTYAPVTLPNLFAAQAWTPGGTGLSGVEANAQINTAYHLFDQQMQHYLGEPIVPNWMTFGKIASREAGQQIMNLEASLEALHTLTGVDGTLVNDDRALNALVRVMAQDKMVEQSIRMSAQSLGVDPSLPPQQLVLEIFEQLSDPPWEAPAKIGLIVGNLEQLHDALVKGNTRIANNIAPAYDIFMQAEMNGQDGLVALKAAGYGGSGGLFVNQNGTTDRDPQGFVLEAFTKYKQAKTTADQIQILQGRLGNPAYDQDELQGQIESLQHTRAELIHTGNLLIGCQEQMGILQDADIFGDPLVSGMLRAMSGTMSLTDPLGTTPLLPGATPTSASWADFPTRMGLDEVPPAALTGYRIANPAPGDPPSGQDSSLPQVIRVEGPAAGSTHYYKVNGNPGTISTYFADRTFDQEKANTMTVRQPREIEPIYTHQPNYAGTAHGDVAWYERALEAGLAGTPIVRTLLLEASANSLFR